MWTFNKTDITELDQFRDRVIRQSFGSQLVLTDLDVEDTGEVGCEASNEEDVVVLEARLLVTGQHDLGGRRRTGLGDTVTLRTGLGDTVTLSCPVSRGEDGEVLSWYRDNLHLTSHTLTANGDLLIEAVKKEDLGRYYCQALTVRL